jgi:hypothetical protein
VSRNRGVPSVSKDCRTTWWTPLSPPFPTRSGILNAGARILRADNGSEVTVSDLARTGERPLVWPLDERKRMVARPVTQVFPSGRQEAFTLRLASGREVEATTNSHLMTTCRTPMPLLGNAVGQKRQYAS